MSLDQLIAVLGTKLDLTAEDIADIFWLTHLQQQSVGEEADVPPLPVGGKMEIIEGSGGGTSGKGGSPPASNPPPQPTSQPLPQMGLVPRKTVATPAKASVQELDRSIKVPNAPSIRDPLALMKALRPLVCRVPSGVDVVLDEAATATKIAEERIWMPVTKPVPEPWLEVALVVDESTSMLIWRRTVLELQHLFKHYGIFRDVRTWGLVLNQNQIYIYPGMGVAAQRKSIRTPQELIDPAGRRLILIVTDCLSSIWWEKTILPALEDWANNGSVAILQMLPERLWARTALRQASAVGLYGLAPGVVNRKLVAIRSSLWDEAVAQDTEETLKVPILSLEPEVASVWSQMVAGKGSTASAGFLFSPKSDVSVETLETQSPSDPLTPKQRLDLFWSVSSPMARRLASLLAASPTISLPVIRLIQETLLPQSNQVHVAEVLLGGLFAPTWLPSLETNPDDVEYRFIDEQTRPILLASAPVTDTVSVLSRYIARKFGKSLDEFIAQWKIWRQSDDQKLAEQVRPFAVVTAEVLKRKGKQYLEFVREVEQYYDISSPKPPQRLSLFPEDRGETLRAKIVENYSPKQLLDIEQARDLASAIDTINSQITCIYTGYSIERDLERSPRQDALKKGIAGETIFPQSKANEIVRSDIHNILPARIEVNSARGNLPFTEVPSNEAIRWFCNGEQLSFAPSEMPGEYSKLARHGFEPRDAAKGKIARIVFYVYTLYRNQSDTNYFEQQQATLRKWHREYPPTEAEIERSRKIANSEQGNSNPFVLDPTLVERIYLKWQQIDFEVATIEVMQSSERQESNITIHRQHQQAWQFTEDLGNGVMLEMVEIPEGSFMMGSPEDEPGRSNRESPQHSVTLQPFCMGKYPVTQAQWEAVAALPQVNRELNPNPSHFKGVDRPVERVSWYDAVEFCDRLSQLTGRDYRLPSEAEWEYACRAGTTTPFHFGETITTELANYDGNYQYHQGARGVYREGTTPVGSFGIANTFGLYDMHGNVWEWCADTWHENYNGAPKNGSAWIDKNDNRYRMLRGGSWSNNPRNCRSANRLRNEMDGTNLLIGFRVVVPKGLSR